MKDNYKNNMLQIAIVNIYWTIYWMKNNDKNVKDSTFQIIIINFKISEKLD